MDRPDILQSIHEILGDILNDYDPSKVKENSLLVEVSAYVDSLTLNEFILSLEDEFEIDVPTGSFDSGTTIAKVIDFIAGKL